MSLNTHGVPNFYEGPAEQNSDVSVHRRYYTHHTDGGLVSGGINSVLFTIDRPAKDIWPYFKDFNLWQNAYGHYYSGVIGDLEGRTFALGTQDNLGAHRYQVLRVIPEHLIVIFQPIPEDGSNGGISPGFHVFMLNEHAGKTTVTITMEHATRTTDKAEEEALALWREKAPELHRKWREIFVVALKKLVHEGR